MRELGRDVRYAARALIKRPGFTVVAIVTLALGIGANTAIFSVVNGVLLRPLPYPDGERLVTVWLTYPHWRDREVLHQYWDKIHLSYPDYLRLRNGSTSFERVGIYRTDEATVSGGELAEVVTRAASDHSLLGILELQPLLGRWFTETEAAPGAPPLAVLSHGYWRRRFGGDGAALGSTVRLNGQPHTVIGVLPPAFRLTDPDETTVPDIWIPVGRLERLLTPDNHIYTAVARLRRDAALARAHDETVSPEYRGARVVPLKEQLVGRARAALHLVWGAAGVILLVTCVSVSNLLLGRSAEREAELAVRRALGGAGWRLTRQVLTESVILALAGGAAGAALAWWSTGSLLALAPDLPRLDAVSVDLTVLGFSLAAAVVTGLVFGIAPAWIATTRAAPARLRESPTRVTQSGRIQEGLVAAQVSLATALLVGAVLLTRTLLALGDLDTGFQQDRLLTFRIEAPETQYAASGEVRAFHERLAASLSALPGVVDVSATSVLPLSGDAASNSIWIASYGPEPDNVAKPEVERRVITPTYLASLGVPVVRGRTFTAADASGSERVMLVSRSAEALWEGRDPIGDRVSLSDEWWTVVGVVGDIRDGELRREPVATVYVPWAQWSPRAATVVLRTAVAPTAVARTVREAVADIDAAVAITDLKSMEQVTADAVAEERFRALLVGGFALLALVLAATGLFGVTAQSVARRTREIAIRMALGARSPEVIRLVLTRVAGIVAVGLAGGLIAAILASRALERFLFGITSLDPMTLVACATVLAGVAAAGAVIPTRGAVGTSLMEALRHE